MMLKSCSSLKLYPFLASIDSFSLNHYPVGKWFYVYIIPFTFIGWHYSAKEELFFLPTGLYPVELMDSYFIQ